MSTVIRKRRIDVSEMQKLGVERWPTWSKGVSSFPWQYDTQETSYLVEGRVTVTPEDGKPVEIIAGDLVVFPAGLSCHWDIQEPVTKHYRFD